MKKLRDDDPLLTYRPFAGLKGRTLISAGPKDRPGPPAAKPSGGNESESEAEAIFRQAVHDVRPLNRSLVKRGEPQQPQPQAVPDNRESELFLQAVQGIGAKIYDSHMKDCEESRPRPRSTSSRLRQLRKGSIKISEELDLHGFFRDEAITRLEQFLAACYAKRRQAVLVITGKGINSQEGPVLQTAVADWLRNQGRGIVAEFHFASQDMGGRGAFVVFLKSRE